MADFLDTIILVTGDGDFVPLVEYLKWGKGRGVEVAAFGRSSSGKLREAADIFINIEELPKVILSSRRARLGDSRKNILTKPAMENTAFQENQEETITDTEERE